MATYPVRPVKTHNPAACRAATYTDHSFVGAYASDAACIDGKPGAVVVLIVDVSTGQPCGARAVLDMQDALRLAEQLHCAIRIAVG